MIKVKNKDVLEMVVKNKLVVSQYIGNNLVYQQKDYFYIQNIESTTNTISFNVVGSPSINLEYFLNGNWHTISNFSTVNIIIQPNEQLFFRGNNDSHFNSENDYITLKSVGKFNAGGNIASIIDKTVTNGNLINEGFSRCFFRLFKGSKIVNAHKLKLYSSNIPAYGYSEMFMNCIELLNAPDFAWSPSLHMYSCYSMFSGCSKLTTAMSDLRTLTLAEHCYDSMFMDCYALSNAPNLPANRLQSYCYYRMFMHCNSLTTTPTILATSYGDYSCYQMFATCINLTTIKNDISSREEQQMGAFSCYQMFGECSKLIAPTRMLSTNLAESCYEGMFYQCTSLNKLPLLPATVGMKKCYKEMFRGCSKIKLNDSQTGEYQKLFRIEISAASSLEAFSNMFADTGGQITGYFFPKTNYYTPNDIVQ